MLLALVLAAVIVIGLVVGAVLVHRRQLSASTVDRAELTRLAGSLPPSPRRSIIRLRVELAESLDAAEAAVEVLGPAVDRFHDVPGLLGRLRAQATSTEASLAAVQERSEAALGPLVPVLRDRVRQLQHVSDGIVDLARRGGGTGDPEVEALGRRVQDELAIIEAHRELPS